ncbi:Oidioi.mRNA.OKI2018_I69.chr2.g7894.t1.cds [Oikopleura dioica]|uniref:Oidioi.mRNA.OKI2018_I69.chr2.g7894.t1.cds n=1 Tax=Oikopleura dioica TaxID=34765 RepID=A0ABN7T878_OIKDI|nr:Oidioi.mRNA.OKI2018_I69.chr2.g7894.t1.cds [Oikopleura dioica]
MPAIRKTRRSFDPAIMDRNLVPPPLKLRKDGTVRSELDLRREAVAESSILNKSNSSVRAKKIKTLRSSFKNLAKIFDRSTLNSEEKPTTPYFNRKNRLFRSMTVKMRHHCNEEQKPRVILRRTEQEISSGIIIWEEGANELLVK